MPEYVRTDEQLDVLASLESCADSLARTRESDRAWKWVVLSLHSALQGAMVCHLSGSLKIGALKDECAEAWLKWLHGRKRGEKAPKIYVASAPQLLKRLTGSARPNDPDCGGILKVTEAQCKSFKSLHALRNEFTHLPPQAWSIEIELIRESTKGVLDILESIASDPWPFRHMEEAERRALDLRIREIREFLLEPAPPLEESECASIRSVPPEIAAEIRDLKI